MTVDLFKEKYGYEMNGVWFPRVTSITSLSRRKWLGFQQAADWGTSIHEAIEAILKGDPMAPNAKIAMTVETFLQWRRSYAFTVADPLNDIERRVFDMEYGYAGTIDMVAEVEGVRGIIDLKTSTSILREHALQTAAYLHAYNKTKGVGRTCETRWILRIDQYQECRGCLAKLREKYGRSKIGGGTSANSRICNHQWSALKGEVEFRELQEYERDFQGFLNLKERWEWANQEWLCKIPNYEKNIRQYSLL